MSTEIILIIIGSFFILVAIASSLKLKVPLGLIGILLIIYGGYSYGNINLQGQIEQAVIGKSLLVEGPINKVQVTSPIENDSVQCRILTTGVYPDAHNKDIWVVLRPSDDRYYPQSDHTNTSYKRNGEWQVITRFGGDQGELYEVIVYETDKEASQFFSTTIEQWKNSQSYPGLKAEEIPSGATEVDRINVALKDNCRGVF